MGRAFIDDSAKAELITIASSPSTNHMFQVENFDALEIIGQSLRDKIFSIEGTDVDLP